MAKIVVETNGAQETMKEVKAKVGTGIQWMKKNPWVVVSAVGGTILGVLTYKNIKLNNELKQIHHKLFINECRMTKTWYQETPMNDKQMNALIDAVDPAFEKCMKELGIKYIVLNK